MRTGMAFLLMGYVLSQFYRAFLAVLAPMLTADLGITAEGLARASAWWFLAFALAQLPVGWALDRIGPGRTTAVLMGLAGGGGAVVFAAAQGPGAVMAAMALLGVGCSSVLMAAWLILARAYPPAVFATLAGALLGAGSLGNIAAAWPLTLAAEAVGWRGALLGLAGVTAAVGLAIWRFVPDPPPAPDAGTGSLLELLRMPALWLILPMVAVNYAPSAGIRGLWIGPYFDEVFGATPALIGQASLVMALAMVAGNFAYGPLDRVFRTRKGVVLAGNLAGVACLGALWAMPASSPWTAVALLAGVGFFGASYAMLMAHGRALFPPHLMGRGVTLMNLFCVGGTGVFQLASARVHTAAGPGPEAAHTALFGFFALALLVGCAIYAFSRDRTD
ncbi:MFS transporter [Rhodobaculum claviforme]|uniref:MFS transporter n=1 Tax=Rhodobaculum claviforme TaxID=1549854 RepID=A0A934TF30_9RHOB|nr:MFS transporter [Rhodobaculum claviforme]MBK5926059.1 MFS transporter [Rhodobaculum claviforme]